MTIFSDLDGTLVQQNPPRDDYNISQEILGLINKGHFFSIVTARSPDDVLLNINKELKCNGPIICENGALIYYPSSGKIISFIPKNDKIKLESIKACIDEECDNETKGLFEDIFKKGYRVWRNRDKLSIISVRVNGEFENKNEIRSICESVKKVLLDKQITKGMNIMNTGFSVTIYPQEINKANAIKVILHDIKRKSKRDGMTVGLGDDENDKDMLDFVDIGFAVSKTAVHPCTFSFQGLDGPKSAKKILLYLQNHANVLKLVKIDKGERLNYKPMVK